jgi:hypothetical protein
VPGAANQRFIECVGPERRLQLAIGLNRIAVECLRPQAEELIRAMIDRNKANGNNPVVCTHRELQEAVWGNRQMANGKVQLARLVFEIRQALLPLLGEFPLIQNVPGRGYVLQGNRQQTVQQVTPFVCGPPIMRPSGFFGRELELKRIFGIWNRFPLQHVAVIGPKRSGKTSLLHYLERIHRTAPEELRPGQARGWLNDAESHHVVFIDCQDARLRTPTAVLQHILKQLGLKVPSPCTLAIFAEILSGIQCRTVLLFDELEAAISNPEFDSGFWTGLRSLAANYTRGLLGYVIALHDDLHELASETDPQSPFLNIFGQSLALGPLEMGEARALIDSSPRPFAEPEVDWILAESGLHPCLLQLLCDTRLTALEEAQSEELWKKEGLQRVSRFRHLLSGK